MKTKTYKVAIKGGAYRLVLASSRREALTHVAKDFLTVTIAKETEIAKGIEASIKIETPGAEDLIELSESPGN